MKCRYKYCKNQNYIEKEAAVRNGGAYYCPECFAEKEQKRNIYAEMKKHFPADTAASINLCINKWVHEKGYTAAYVFYVATNTGEEQYRRLKGIFGFVYLLNNTENIKSYEQYLFAKKYRDIVGQGFAVDTSETEFQYKSKDGREWCKVI